MTHFLLVINYESSYNKPDCPDRQKMIQKQSMKQLLTYYIEKYID